MDKARRVGMFAVVAALAFVLLALDYQAMRQRSELGLALAAVQVVLLIALAIVARRELLALKAQRRSLEALADTLTAARHGAEAANRSKSVFLANMSHEIRTPFHGMLGMMSLLQDGGLSPQQAEYLDTARESAQHLLTILNDILDVSQLESGHLQVSPQTVDLLRLVAQVDALMRVQAQAKGLTMRVAVAPDVPRWVHADPTRVKQILFNLLSNAIKFTANGTIVLGVANAAPGTGGISGRAHPGLDFSVADSGIGMDEATTARLFRRFMRGDGGPSEPASGTGLGLEIARDLARLMGGDITVRSAPGAGSTFTVTLPLQAAAAPALAAHDIATPAAAGFRPLRVLVAEDHPVNRAYLEAVIDRLGHRGVFRADGAGALRAIEEQTLDDAFDIVLMDLHMPGMDGFSAARAIRALPAPRGRVPIIALTADAFQTSRDHARAAGMDGFLTKPAHLPQLREVLERHTGRGTRPPSQPPGAVFPPGSMEPTRPDGAWLDAATVEDRVHSLSARKYGELLGGFFDARHRTIDALRAAIAADARADLRSQAHALKGASLNLGMKRAGEIADRLQAGAASAPADALRQTADALERAFEASLGEFQRRGLLAADTSDTAARAAAAPPPLTPPAAPVRA